MEESKMKELDCVEVTVEKEKYARDGVHKGMNGWICDPRRIDGYWLVNFPQYGEKENIATLEIKERFGKNAILKGTNLQDCATTIERNKQIGGHKA